MSISATNMTLECGICCQPFDSYLRKPMLTSCGHSVCNQCRKGHLTGWYTPCCESLSEEEQQNCDNCRKLSCFYCRHPRALQVPIYDINMRDNLEETNQAMKALDKEILLQYCAINKERLKKEEMEEKLNKAVEEEKQLKMAIEQAEQKLGHHEDGVKCRNCEGGPFRERRLRICVDCDREALSETPVSITIADEAKVMEKVLCDHCFIYSDHVNHRSMSIQALKRCAHFDKHFSSLSSSTDSSITEDQTDIVDLKKDYMKARTEDKATEILQKLEALFTIDIAYRRIQNKLLR